MMLDILLTNRAAVLAALGHYQNEMAALASLLKSGDAEGLRVRLAAIRAERRRHFP